jgi:hypothetical protein
MALNTDSSHIPVGQEESVRRPVGKMADGASFHLDGGMFKDPGASLLGMAFKAGIDIVINPASRP